MYCSIVAYFFFNLEIAEILFTGCFRFVVSSGVTCEAGSDRSRLVTYLPVAAAADCFRRYLDATAPTPQRPIPGPREGTAARSRGRGQPLR